ncbi:unnamed protein product [Rangifer tarandus platyrhynchus]|uniref:Uncharacterized protein n=2 Tax=Rangifer tarandus platyrhynchus TaxID=3082113 RepID=A0ABN8ZFL2_RANTA|nr:unnamed protein product [Rangifer tarandus platyrhynchus]
MVPVCESRSVMSDSAIPWTSLPGFSVHGSLQASILEWVAVPVSGDLPDPGIEPGSPARQADSLPSEPPGKMILNPFYPSIRIADLWRSLIGPARVTRPASV